MLNNEAGINLQALENIDTVVACRVKVRDTDTSLEQMFDVLKQLEVLENKS